MVIPEVRQERLYQKIANLIIKLINDNIFPPGTFLPPERELAKQLGVSRASLREALIVLEISGWIVIQSGNGVIVSDKKHLASDYTIEEILSTRELVDSHCARLAAQNDNVDVINQSLPDATRAERWSAVLPAAPFQKAHYLVFYELNVRDE